MNYSTNEPQGKKGKKHVQKVPTRQTTAVECDSDTENTTHGRHTPNEQLAVHGNASKRF